MQMAKLEAGQVAQLGDAAVTANLHSDVCVVAVVNGENANEKVEENFDERNLTILFSIIFRQNSFQNLFFCPKFKKKKKKTN